MKKTISWFYTIDKKLWGDKIEPNPYFATLSILFVALMGACSGAGRIFYEWFDWNVATNNVAMAYLFILIWGMNLCESIVASKSAWIGLWRPLLMLACLAVFFALGFIASVVVIVLVIGCLFLFVVSGVLSTGSTGGKGRGGLFSDGQIEQYGYDENGSQYTMRDIGGGYAWDDCGRRWKNAGGTKWEIDE